MMQQSQVEDAVLGNVVKNNRRRLRMLFLFMATCALFGGNILLLNLSIDRKKIASDIDALKRNSQTAFRGHERVPKWRLQQQRKRERDEENTSEEEEDATANRHIVEDHRMANQERINHHSYEWHAVGDTVVFLKRMNYKGEKEQWVELQDGEERFFYEELGVLGDSVLLFDESRHFQIKLDEDKAQLKMTSDPDKSYSDLYDGYWVLFDGTPMNMEFEMSKDQQPLKPPPPTHQQFMNPHVKILLMLAAYRDPLCGNTLAEAFQHAKYPDRIYASVVEQIDVNNDDAGCLEEYCRIDQSCRRDQVKVQSVGLEKSRGVMPARFRQMLGIEDEEFCLQTDSHSAFEDDWDILALNDWLLTENEMAVLTTYPNKVEQRHNQKYSPARCSTKFDPSFQVVHGGNSAHNVRPGEKPYLVPFFGAGVVFSKCHANLNVPYDPYMSYLFGGEEFNRAARLFTWGYDMYAPKHNFVYHYYDDEQKPTQGSKPRHREFAFITPDKKLLGTQTTARWRRVLGLKPRQREDLSERVMTDANLFGLGNRRTLKQYLEFAGVNLETHELESRCSRLGRMKWVPYEFETPFYPSGPRCRGEAYTCCTTLERVKKNAMEFLELTNSQASELLKASKPYQDDEKDFREIISPHASNAYPLPCK